MSNLKHYSKMIKGISFKNALVQSGTKSVNEAYPEISLTSSYNGFKLNNKAAKLLGVGSGDRVIMFDAKYSGAEGQDDRYYIGKEAIVEGEDPSGAKLGKVGHTFNYSGIYGTMLLQDFDVASVNADELVSQGKLVKRTAIKEDGTPGTVNYISTETASGELVAFQDGEPVEIDEGVEMVLYQVTGLRFSDHTPKVVNKDDEDVTPDED